LECGGFEGEAAVGVGAVGSVEVLGVEVVEEELCPAPDPGDVVQPPPWQAQNLYLKHSGFVAPLHMKMNPAGGGDNEEALGPDAAARSIASPAGLG
jgi:hypothetical protein